MISFLCAGYLYGWHLKGLACGANRSLRFVLTDIGWREITVEALSVTAYSDDV